MSKIEFDYRSCDREIWEEELDDFVPDRILDAHIHLFWKSCLDNVKPRFPGGDANIQTLNKWAEVLYPGRKMQYLILGTDIAKHTDACHVYGFHDFKRAFATNNASTLSPAQLQRLMKHSDFSTTQGYINYAKVMTEKPNVFLPDVLKQEHGGRTDSR